MATEPEDLHNQEGGNSDSKREGQLQDQSVPGIRNFKELLNSQRKQANRLVKQKNVEAAREVYEQTLRVLPAQSLEAAIVQRDLALLLRVQDLSLSDLYFHAVLSSTASNPQFQAETHILLGKHLLKMRHFPAAEETLHQALHIASTLPTDSSQVTRVTFALGRCCEEVRQEVKAVEFYQQGINTAKSSSFKSKCVLSKIMQRCASLHLRLGQFEKAEVMLKQLLEVNQSIQAVKKPYQMLSRIYKTTARISDYQTTKELLAQVYYLQPKNFNPVIMVSRIVSRIMDYKDTLYSPEATEELCKSFYQAHMSLPQSLLSAKAFQKLAEVFATKVCYKYAEMAFQQSIETVKAISPEGSAAILKANRKLAVFYEARGDVQKAEASYIEILELSKSAQNPKQVLQACKMLGAFYEGNPSLGEAESVYKSAIEFSIRLESPILCQCYQVLGFYYQRRNRLAEARNCIESAYECVGVISSQLERAIVLYRLGRSLLFNDFRKVKQCFDSALEILVSKASDSWLTVLVCKKIIEWYKNSITSGTEVKSIHMMLLRLVDRPDLSPFVYYLLGNALVVKGDLGSAEKAYLKICSFEKQSHSREELRLAIQLAVFYANFQRTAESEAFLLKIVEAFYQNRHCSLECADASSDLGHAYLLSGQISKAIPAFKFRVLRYLTESHLPSSLLQSLRICSRLDSCYRRLKDFDALETCVAADIKFHGSCYAYDRCIREIRNIYAR